MPRIPASHLLAHAVHWSLQRSKHKWETIMQTLWYTSLKENVLLLESVNGTLAPAISLEFWEELELKSQRIKQIWSQIPAPEKPCDTKPFDLLELIVWNWTFESIFQAKFTARPEVDLSPQLTFMQCKKNRNIPFSPQTGCPTHVWDFQYCSEMCSTGSYLLSVLCFFLDWSAYVDYVFISSSEPLCVSLSLFSSITCLLA